MKTFIISILISVLKDPEVWEQIEKLFGNLIAKQILPVVPVAAGAAAKAGVDEVISHIPGANAVADVVKTTEAAANGIINMIPGVSSITAALKAWGITP